MLGSEPAFPVFMFTLFGMAFVSVCIRAFQQQNVTQSRYFLIIPTAYAMTFAELFVIYTGLGSFSTAPWMTGFVMGTGGWLGCWVALELHKRI